MKIDLIYPKIPEDNCSLKTCYAFEKIDGTNCHALYEEGWQSFGTRRTSFSFSEQGNKDFCKEHPGLEEVYATFCSDWKIPLGDHLATYFVGRIICFFEFWGLNSFAGEHQAKDPKKLILFDVEVNRELLPPKEFIRWFKTFNTARLIYQGRFTGIFTEDVRNGRFNLNEGVVCKGLVAGQLHMTKIKTTAYLKRLTEG